MNTIGDSLIEKLEELYPKTKPEVETVKEEPVAVKPWVPDITRVAVLDQMMIKESAYGSSVNFKQYIDNRTTTPLCDLEFRMKVYIRQEIDKLKCSLSKPT